MDLSLIPISLFEFQMRKSFAAGSLEGDGELQTQAVPVPAELRHPQCLGWSRASKAQHCKALVFSAMPLHFL